MDTTKENSNQTNPDSVLNLLHQSIYMYKAKFVSLTITFVIPFVVLIALQLLTVSAIFADSFYTLVFSTILTFLIGFVAQSLSNLASVLIIKNDTLPVKQAYREASKFFFAYVWLTILQFLIVGGGVLFLIIPGLIFAFWYSLYMFILVDQNLKGLAALAKSKYYVKGNFFWLLARMLFLILLFFGISVLTTNLGGLLDSMFFSNSTEIYKEIVPALVSIIITPFSLVYAYHVYQALKTKVGEPTAPVNAGKLPVFFAIVGLIVVVILLGTMVFAASTMLQDAGKSLPTDFQKELTQTD